LVSPFDITLLLNQIMQFLGTFGAVLVVLGFVIAFAHKLYFIIELISGMVITAVVTYVVWAVTKDPLWTAVAFLLFLVGTIVSAAAASILAIIDGFLISLVGLVALFLPNQGLTAGMVFTSAILAAISTAAAAVLGSLDFGNLRVPLFSSLKRAGGSFNLRRWSRTGTPASIASVCPSCGFHNRPGSLYCRKDGTALVSARRQPPHQVFQPLRTSKTCANCGSVNRAGASFCRICRAGLR
jgi:hypothetical protein